MKPGRRARGQVAPGGVVLELTDGSDRGLVARTGAFEVDDDLL
jgi:hypothetical protein